MTDFKSGQDPFAASPDIPAGVDPFASEPPRTNTLGQELGRQAGLTGRALLSAAGSFGAIPADAIGKAVNYVAGREVIPNQQRALQQTLTRMGLPEPERPMERFTQGMADTAPAFALPATLPAQAFGNAAMAATQAQPGQEGSQALIGGALGAGGHALARTLGGLVRPTPEARTLIDRGVALTPGQAAGPGTITNKVEQWASSNPVAGIPIRNAQRRAVQESNVAAAQSVANVVDENIRLGLPPSEAIERTRDAISRTYNNALEGMAVPGFVPEVFMRSVWQRSANDFPMLEQAQVNQMGRFITQRVGGMVRNGGGTLDGQMLKQLDSELGGHIRNLRASTNAADKTAAPAWAELQQSLREVMELGHANPEQSAMLRNANAAYRQLLALEKARLPGSEQFTPRQLARQVEKGDLGNTQLGNVSRAMSATLPNTVPDSGTAERLIANALPAALIGGGGAAQGMGYDTVGAGLMAAGALGSRPGSRFITGGYGVQPYAEIAIRELRRMVPGALAGKRDERK